ncbi:MAG: DUF2934 domain-containing protein [Sideroxydans sp.]|jgi:hypothetical protein|nr:DUF2934 domain-containing protein [Methylotenera sp.]MDZ4263147.1 DUF2934 domain-containing protein [Pseudomonadota bacterium]NOT18802.1 DUF2934 domain-containing protein [Sideroxydans sp.]
MKEKRISTNTKTNGDATLTEEQRQHYIEVAAYNIAESKGFISGCDLESWLAAEAEVDCLLA